MMLRSLVSAILVGLLYPSAAAGETPPFPFTLSKPAGDGRFPAVVILHDCSGLGPRSSGMAWRWSSELTHRGYVTLWPDSFTPRGRPKGVCAGAAPPRITYEQRAGDAYAALAYLASLPFVNTRQIAVMGGSHGGSSTLAAIVDTPENGKRIDTGFAAAIALYPACGRSYGDWSVQRRNRPGRPITGYAGAFKPVARPTTPSTASCRYVMRQSASTRILRPGAVRPPAATPRPGPTRSTKSRASSIGTTPGEGGANPCCSQGCIRPRSTTCKE